MTSLIPQKVLNANSDPTQEKRIMMGEWQKVLTGLQKYYTKTESLVKSLNLISIYISGITMRIVDTGMFQMEKRFSFSDIFCK